MIESARHAGAAVVLAAAATVLLAGCSGKERQAATPAPSDVTLTQAQRQHLRLYKIQSSWFHRTVEVNGVVDFDNDQASGVLAPFGGRVTRVLVALGQQVGKGQALAEVDSPDYAAAVSAYRKAAATAAVTRGIANRDQDLLRHQAIAQRELDQARTDAANAEADRKAALQALVAMNVGAGRLGDIEQGAGAAAGVIRAPISGTVVERPVTAGLLLQAGTTPVVTIADLSRVWVMAQVFEADLPFVRVGETARIQAGGTSLPGTVENIGAEVDPATGAVPARIAVDNRAGLLKKQMYVRVAIEALRPSAGVVVPASAILRDDENLPFVYVAQPDGGFGRRRIVQGPRVGAGYQVADGLRAGEQIVVDGAIFVQFMQDQ